MTLARPAVLLLICAAVLIGSTGARAVTFRLTPNPPPTFHPARPAPPPPVPRRPLPHTGEDVLQVLLAGLLLLAAGLLLRACGPAGARTVRVPGRR